MYVVAYGTVRSEDPQLLLPHPGAAFRSFVLVPWAALEPDAVLRGRTVAERATEFAGEILERRDQWA